MTNLTHGARSPSRVATKALNHRRRFLHRGGLRAGDLDPVASELLRLWSFAAAQLELREAGGADASKDYWTCFNSCQRTLVRLEQRLRVLGLDRGATAKRAVSVVEFYRARQQAGLSARDGQDDE